MPVLGRLRLPVVVVSAGVTAMLKLAANPRSRLPVTSTMFVAKSALVRTVSFSSVVASSWGSRVL
jgi:hypothetical protein